MSSRLEESLRLVCPAPGVLDSIVLNDALKAILEIKNKHDPCHPLRLIGTELRIAFLAIGNQQLEDGDNDFWLRKCRQLCLRPAVEPLLLSHWRKLKNFEMDEKGIAAFCSMLHGSNQTLRTGDSYGLWDNVRFESPDVARSWWSDIKTVAKDPQFATLLPAYAYARTIIAHPFPDGNGRLARALVHASLARISDLSAPILPLAPAFYKHGGKIADAIRKLSGSGNWNEFASTFAVALHEAGVLAGRIH